jgi:sugar/nucleoside kinase (ribokinase family)
VGSDLERSSSPEFDAVALGLNAVDHLVVVPQFPQFNSKVQYVSHSRLPGGQSATAMVALARLGLKTRYIGTVGSDDDGRFQLESIAAEGVDISSVSVIDGAQSQNAFIIVDQATGERTILWNRDPRLTIAPESVDKAAVISGRVLHLDGHNVAASVRAAAFAKDAGIPTTLDIDNFYPGTEELLPLIDYNICSSDFPRRATGESDLRTALRLLALRSGARVVASTIGKDGVLAYADGRYIQSPGFKVDCVDTTGAGDAFHAGFIYGLLEEMSIEECLRFGNAVAALNCRSIGARTALPTLDEVKSLLSGAG